MPTRAALSAMEAADAGKKRALTDRGGGGGGGGRPDGAPPPNYAPAAGVPGVGPSGGGGVGAGGGWSCSNSARQQEGVPPGIGQVCTARPASLRTSATIVLLN